MRGQQRWLILAGAVAAVIVLFVVLRNGADNESNTTTATTATTGKTANSTPDETTTAPAQPTIVEAVVRDGKVVGGPQVHDLAFKKPVVVVVTSDVADEVHVHGYDLMKDVAAGATVKIGFVANLSGRFEFELEGAHLRLGELSVAPS